ncbi:RagB/SusD family nutrient uptake outer membrane protein, partial [Flagellimonas abyssi]
FEAGDGRLQAWVGQVFGEIEIWYYANKYKLNAPSPSTEECSILFRLSELYLIGAEAYARLGQDAEALIYLNRVRHRALLAPISGLSGTALLDAIYKERAVELFSEQGHRFFDLKRTARA